MNATVKRFIQERNSIKSIFRGAKNSRVSIRGTKRSCRILTLKFHEEIFTKVTPPLGSRAAMRVGSSPFRRTKRERHLLKADAFLFWVPPPRGRLHPSVIEMLGVNDLPLRRGFRLRQKRLYGAKAPPRRAGPHVLLASILLRCSIVGASFAKLAPIF